MGGIRVSTGGKGVAGGGAGEGGGLYAYYPACRIEGKQRWLQELAFIAGGHMHLLALVYICIRRFFFSSCDRMVKGGCSYWMACVW